MAERTLIAWTHHTFNIAWGCTKISPGCTNCYADELSGRYGFDVWGPRKPRRTFGAKHWAEPLKWNRDAQKAGELRRVFCSSMCDVFEEHETIDQERAKLWSLIQQTPWLDWQLLTKRAERIARCLPDCWDAICQQVWLGVSIENNDYAWRADHLRGITAAAVRFVSYEPALGPLDQLDLIGLNWVIYGGESGAKHRPEDKQWARDMMSRCRKAGVAFFHKQSADRFTERGVELDGQMVREYPQPRRFPLPTLFG
jgi:protein gp37